MNATIALKQEMDESLEILQIRFRYYMGIAEIFAPIFIQSIPAALTIVSIGKIFPALLHIDQGFAWVLAVLTGIGMELLGLVSVDIYFAAKTFNQVAHPDGKRAPEGAALLVMVIYAVTALLIVVFLKMFVELAIFSLIPLTLMSVLIVSAVTMKKRIDDMVAQRERECYETDNIGRLTLLTEALTQRNTELTERDITLTAEVTDLTEFKTRLTEQVDKLTEQIEKLTCELTAEVTELTEKSNRLTEELTSLTEKSNRLTQKNAILQRELHEKQANIEPVRVTNGVTQDANSKEQRQQKLLDILTGFNGQSPDVIVNARIADTLGTTGATIGRDLKELTDANKISVNGVVKVLA